MGTSQERGQTAPRAANQVRVLSGGRADGTERERTLCGDQDPRDQRHSVMSAKASSRVRASSAAPRTPRPSSASRVPLSTMTSASSSVRRRTFRWCLSECPSKAGKRSRSSGAATSSSQPCARHYTGTPTSRLRPLRMALCPPVLRAARRRAFRQRRSQAPLARAETGVAARAAGGPGRYARHPWPGLSFTPSAAASQRATVPAGAPASAASDADADDRVRCAFADHFAATYDAVLSVDHSTPADKVEAAALTDAQQGILARRCMLRFNTHPQAYPPECVAVVPQLMMGVIRDVHAASCFANEHEGAVLGRSLRRHAFGAAGEERTSKAGKTSLAPARLQQGVQNVLRKAHAGRSIGPIVRTVRGARGSSHADD